MFFCFFFFQAEDGIRDDLVTGVQTCALPIFAFRAHRPDTVSKSETDTLTRGVIDELLPDTGPFGLRGLHISVLYITSHLMTMRALRPHDRSSPGTSGSLDVLHLLAELLELALGGEHQVRDREVARLGARRVALAVEGTERRAERPLQRRPLPSEVGGFLGYLEQTRQPQHVAERRPARQPQRLHELAHGADVRPRESGLHRHAIPALRRDRRAQHRHLDPSALRRLPHAIADLRLPCRVLARHRHLDVEEALVEAAYLDRHARAACLGRAGAVARHAPHAHRRTSRASSSALTVAVPIFPTTTPAAWLASTVASSSVPPAPSASAQAASTVSPAPVTSNTSRAAVRNSSTTTPCGPRLKSAIPSSPREMSTAPASHRSRSRAPASRKVAASWMSTPEAAAASSRLGFTSDARR